MQEIIASHGTYRDPDRNFGSTSIGHGLQVDWVLNDKFEADPKKYLVSFEIPASFILFSFFSNNKCSRLKLFKLKKIQTRMVGVLEFLDSSGLLGYPYRQGCKPLPIL